MSRDVSFSLPPFVAFAEMPRHLITECADYGERSIAETETVALDLTCAECGRSPRAGETWRILFADIGEAVTYCPEG
jgi:hypothetical protein